MVRFLTTRGHEYTAKKLVDGEMAGARVPPCAVENYDRFLRKHKVPCGTYIFTDIERLTPWELRVIAEAYHVLAADERCRVLNNPARVMTRYELLRNLREEGINDFDAIRADERRWPARYPVFLRHEQDHGRPLSTDLLHTREELEAALENVQVDRTLLPGLLVVVDAVEVFDGLGFRKSNTFREGNEGVAHQLL